LKTPVKFRRKYFKLVLKGSVEADDRCSHNLIWVDGILLSVRRSLASASRLELRQLVGLDDDFLLTVAGLIRQAMAQMKGTSVFLTRRLKDDDWMCQ